MNILDIFKGNAFNVTNLTNAINLIPHIPSKIGKMGLFKARGVTSHTVILEERDGVIMLIPNQARNAPAKVSIKRPRRARPFEVFHLPLDDAVFAYEVSGIRAFGSQSQTEGVMQVVNDKIAVMRQSHELTLEWHRAGAIKGVVFDADNSTVLCNLYEEYGIHKQDDVDFVLGTDTTSQKKKCLDISRLVEEALGAATYDHIHAYCGKTFFDAFVEHATVKTAYEHWGGLANMGGFLREDQRRGFPFADIVFEEYRGKITPPGGTATKFIADDECRIFPVGVPDLFLTYFAPADFVETVNTVGRPFYAKQQMMDMNRGINIATESNPLSICTRPRVLIRGFSSN